jgi:hypothetical protein
MTTHPTAPSATQEAADPRWRTQELLLSQVVHAIGKTLAPGVVLRERLQLISELLGLNRSRIVPVDGLDQTEPMPARRRCDDALRQGQLRRHSREPVRARTLRPRARRLHRRACGACRLVRAGGPPAAASTAAVRQHGGNLPTATACA